VHLFGFNRNSYIAMQGKNNAVLQVKCPMVHWNNRMLPCSSTSVHIQFG